MQTGRQNPQNMRTESLISTQWRLKMWLEDVNLIYLTGRLDQIICTIGTMVIYYKGDNPKCFGAVEEESQRPSREHFLEMFIPIQVGEIMVLICDVLTQLLTCKDTGTGAWKCLNAKAHSTAAAAISSPTTSSTCWFPHSSFMDWDEFRKYLLIFPCLEFRFLC